MSLKKQTQRLFVGAFIASCVSTASYANETADWKLKATEEVRKEKSIVEAMFPENSNSSFWASMRDDGSRRDGFADYLCLVLKDAGMPKGEFLVIKIWDAYRLAQDDLHEIGRSDCKKS